MRNAWLVVAVALLAGCARNGAPPAAGETHSAAAAPAASNLVVLASQAQKDAGVETEPAVTHIVRQTVRVPARLTNDENRTWRVGAITEGRVVQVLAAPGDFVTAGRPLARIHSRIVHDSRAEFRNAQIELTRATENYRYTLKTRDRAVRLYGLKAGSLQQKEHSEADLGNAEAALNRAKNEVERTRRHLVEFLGVAEEDGGGQQPGIESGSRDLIPIRAPASGTVLTRNITPGAVVTTSTDLFVLSDLSSIWAIAEVNQDHLPRLRAGMPVRVFVQAWPEEPFHGTIGRIGEELDAATRTIKVRVNLTNRGGRLKPEMFATAELSLGGTPPAVFVPEESAQQVRGQEVVFVRIGADRFEARQVETGRKVNGELEIRRGVRAGEIVATKGAFILKSECMKATLAGE